MGKFTERMNMQFGNVEGAHVMKRVNMGFAAYETLCLICSELDINLDNVANSEFDSAGIALSDFVNSANEGTGYTVSVWFDN